MRQHISFALAKSLVICCVTGFSWSDTTHTLLSSDRKPTTEHSTKSHLQSQAWWTRNLYCGHVTGVYVRGCLWQQKWLKYNCITKAHPSMGDSSQGWDPRAYCTLAVSLPDWRLSLPGTSIGFSLFQAARLVSAFRLLWVICRCDSALLRGTLISYLLIWQGEA